MSETSAPPFLLQPGADPALAQTLQPIKYITPPMPPVEADNKKYYINTVPNASMYRTDGMRITFRNGYYGTKLLPDQQYLEQEIAMGCDFLRPATEEEIYQIRMAENPREVIATETRAELEAEIEARIRAEYETKLAGLQITDENRLAGTDAVSTSARAEKSAVKSGSASVFMTSQAPSLKGIVNSSSNPGGSADSGV